MKKVLVMILVVCMMLSMTVASAETSVYELDSYEDSDEDLGNGYTLTVTLEIGPWVKATDTDAISAAWKAVDGPGDAPEAGDFKWAGHNLKAKTSIMCFGTVSFKDTTPGDFQISDGGTIYIPRFTMNNSRAQNWADSAVYYSSETDHRSDFLFVMEIRPSLKRRTWGPVPFAICVENVLSPEYPNGDPSIFEKPWICNMGEIYIEPSWEY